MAYQPIENYGIIGNLNTVALIGMHGSIDFLSFPYFDSPTVFAALLDEQQGGCFQLAPMLGEPHQKQLYLPDTAVLLSRFLSDDGVAEISDFMPIDDASQPGHRLIRRAKTIRGEVRFRMQCAPRFDYGRAPHRVDITEGGVVFASQGNDGVALRLWAGVPVSVQEGAAVAEFTLRSHESVLFVLEEAMPGQAPLPTRLEDYTSQAFKDTVNFWRRWIGRSTYKGRWREMVSRSAITLKLLTSQRYGSMVAAPTLGLPETIGGERNWDYRYTWIRDSAFMLYGLMRLGYTQEAAAFMRWIEARCGALEDGGALQIMYGIDGRHQLTEETLSHLEGYKRSAPVRLGNGAYNQLQLDIYGELMDAVYLYNKYGEPISHDLWMNLTRLLDWVCHNWHRKDEGIWEVRGGQQEFLYSRLMCWAAIDRGIRLAQKRSFPAPLDHWHTVRSTIYQDIFTHFWSPSRQAFVQHKGSTTLDASNLLMPLVKFISPTDPRWLSTLRAIESELVDDSLVYRYRVEDGADGLRGKEGTFCMCTFWYVECLGRSGDVEGARYFFEKALGYANHLGLYAEELGPRGEHLGNFPQAFTHLSLISAAYDLDRRLSATGWRA